MTTLEERIDLHDRRLDKQEERLNQHGQRIQQLEKYDKEKHLRLQAVEENYAKLESTVAKENKETRSTMKEQTGKLFDIVEQAMGYQESRTTQTHELRMAKLNTWSTVFLKASAGLVGLLSSGGVVYYIIEQLVK